MVDTRHGDARSPFLLLNEVSKTIGKQQIVEPVTIKLERGHALALCGGNGAGKSTILRMIAGIIHPTVGNITLGGLAWKKSRKDYAALLGYMPDDFRFGTALSAWETICFYASLRHVGKYRAEEVLRLVDLMDHRHKSVAAFSKGMRQRLMFAQSILAQPSLLLMDEPTNGLDPYWTDMFAELVLNLKKQGTAIVFSTHHLEIAEQTADDALFLQSGQVMSYQSVEQLKIQYGDLSNVFSLSQK